MFHGSGRRMLGRGDFRLILLELIARSPKHGYSLIEEIERLTGGIYSPSPGIIYPALLFLEEGELITSTQENNRKIYRITERGSAVLAENRERIEFILDRISRFGSFFARAREGRRSFWAREEGKSEEASKPAQPRDFVSAALAALESTVGLARGRVPEAVLVEKLKAVERAIADIAMGTAG
jgi:DNA-binding PadR family transcriptional regulator